MLADVAVGPADDQDLVEGDDQLGALLAEDLEVLDDLPGLIVLDVDGQEHPGGVLGDVVAERVAAEELLERLGGLGEPAGLEEGLAPGVELVGRGPVGVGRGLAGGEDLERRPARPCGPGRGRRPPGSGSGSDRYWPGR